MDPTVYDPIKAIAVIEVLVLTLLALNVLALAFSLALYLKSRKILASLALLPIVQRAREQRSIRALERKAS
jgi:hypothetical protein